MPGGEGFSCRTRRFSAGIPCVLQAKATMYAGKRPAQATVQPVNTGSLSSVALLRPCDFPLICGQSKASIVREFYLNVNTSDTDTGCVAIAVRLHIAFHSSIGRIPPFFHPSHGWGFSLRYIINLFQLTVKHFFPLHDLTGIGRYETPPGVFLSFAFWHIQRMPAESAGNGGLRRALCSAYPRFVSHPKSRFAACAQAGSLDSPV